MFKSNGILIGWFVAFITGLSLWSLLSKDVSFSEAENRYLQQLPAWNWDRVVSGEFTKEAEKYVSDQFIGRDYWVGLKSDMERLRQRKENNGIYFGKDDYLLEKAEAPVSDIVKDNVEGINQLARTMPHIPIRMLLVPNSVKVLDDKLPAYAVPYDQGLTIKNVQEWLEPQVQWLDVLGTLRSYTGSAKDNLYYKTDHHWTIWGAYAAYQALCKQMGWNPVEVSWEKVTDRFQGSYYSKANIRRSVSDEIVLPHFAGELLASIIIQDDGRKLNSMYAREHLDKKNKYDVFLDGNHALITIRSNVKNNKKLLVVKDSYAHCFVPFLLNHYEEIHMLDLRYYNLKVRDYIKEAGITEILLLYNVSTFSQDPTIKLIGR
ncbi:hypothetical protein E0485_17700 [Paenibacillus albiflavus]|uniref:AlgX/AlgJ SGNH hydrolase-like domain-containing protein n=1 Tax=Paenibacillus albiflavus TaxID=2545760 RepID=A0A4R4E6T1_9BACL|nr:DHHW family protein [Paenibacillus albiflavus]TCZ75434.1 hypothetical protein E0485_17700 [Paenibacillus albiflavus]